MVYALLDDTGTTLYVGQTNQLANRLRAHRAPRSRTNGYATWLAEECPSREHALSAEALAIHALQPPLNRLGI